MSLAYVIDAILGVVCLIMVGRRYRGHSVRLIPGDMVLWTFTLFFILPLFLDATDYVAVYRTYPELQTVSSVPEVHIISALTVLVGIPHCTDRSTDVGNLCRANGYPPPLGLVPHRALPSCRGCLSAGSGSLQPHGRCYQPDRPGEPFFAMYTNPSPTARYHVYVTWSTLVSSCLSGGSCRVIGMRPYGWSCRSVSWTSGSTVSGT